MKKYRSKRYQLGGSVSGGQKSKRGEKRIERAVEKRRERLQRAAPEVYADLGESYETPAGLPSLEEFAVKRDVDRAYGEAHPMRGATKMTDLGPIMFERWLGKKNSSDGTNYRAPYYRAAEITENPNVSPEIVRKATGESNFGGGYRNDVVSKYKKAHKQYQQDKTTLDKVRGAIGSILPPANVLLAGGASLGGRNIPEALATPVGAAAFIPMYNMLKRKSNTGSQPSQASIIGEGVADAAMGALGTLAGGYGVLGKGVYQGGAGDLVVPTPGIGLNPFAREAREIKKDTRQDLKKLREAKSRDVAGKSGRLDAITNREAANVDRLIRLYEKKYGVTVNKKQAAPRTYQPMMGGGIMKFKNK